MENYYSRYDWETMLKANAPGQYSVSEYHKILSPKWPDFLDRYLELPLLQRLKLKQNWQRHRELWRLQLQQGKLRLK